MLWDPGSHERLDESTWEAGAARDRIAAIVAEAEDGLRSRDCDLAAASARTWWARTSGRWWTVYLGAAGVVWALARLGAERDWAAVARELPQRYRETPDPPGRHPSLLCGESGVLLAEELVTGETDRERLAAAGRGERRR